MNKVRLIPLRIESFVTSLSNPMPIDPRDQRPVT